jgi:hypothetical protein
MNTFTIATALALLTTQAIAAAPSRPSPIAAPRPHISQMRGVQVPGAYYHNDRAIGAWHRDRGGALVWGALGSATLFGLGALALTPPAYYVAPPAYQPNPCYPPPGYSAPAYCFYPPQ